MIRLYWLEKLFKKIKGWFKVEEKEETLASASSMPSSSLSPSVSPSAAISEATSVSEKFQNDLEKLTNELQLQKDKVNEARENARQILDDVKYMKGLMMFGVFIMLLMVAGLVFGYWQYVYDSVRRDDYKYGFSEKINNQANEVTTLKEKNEKLLDISNCQKGKKYWQYEECFKK